MYYRNRGSMWFMKSDPSCPACEPIIIFPPPPESMGFFAGLLAVLLGF